MNTASLFPRLRLSAALAPLLAAPFIAFAPSLARASAAACGDTYTVRPGDSLWSISRTCGVPLATIQRLNHLGAYLQPGQVVQLTDPALLRSYVVQPGDTLVAIAQRVGVAPAALAAINGLANPDVLPVGRVLHWSLADVAGGTSPSADGRSTAPVMGAATTVSSATYRVRPGDTLWSIAQAHGTTVAALAGINAISDPLRLRVGSIVRLPIAAPAPQGAQPAPVAQSSPTTLVTTGSYLVKPGDTLWGIAQALGITPDTLAQANNLDPAQPIRPGQMLRYPVVVYTGPSPAEVGAVLDQQSAQVGVEDALLKAVAWRESSWRMVDSPDGGIGVMQLMPDTVSWLQQTYVPGSWDPHNLTDNVHAGAVLLEVYSRLYDGDVAKIATAYHGGMGAVGGHASAEMQSYVNAVIAFRQAFLNGTLSP